MQKVFFSLALLVGTAGMAQAQSMLSMSRLSFGVKGGGSASNFSGSDATGTTGKAGFTAGLFVGYKITEHFSIQEDFLYSQRGAKMDNFLLKDHKLNSTLGYFDVPFMLRYTFGRGGTGFFLEAGPTVSILLHQKTTVEDNAGQAIASLGTDKDQFRSIVAGYAGGLGYNFGNGLQVGARYNGGLMSVYKDDLGYPKLHNADFQLQIAYGFGGK